MKRDDKTRGHTVLEQDEGKHSSNGITFHMWGEDDQTVYFVPSERGSLSNCGRGLIKL